MSECAMFHLLERHYVRGKRVWVRIGSFTNELEAIARKFYMEKIRKDCGYAYKIIDRDLEYSDMYPDD